MEKKGTDYILLIYFIILLTFGFLALSSASVSVGMQKFGSDYYFVKHQFLRGVLPGIVLFLFFLNLDIAYLKKAKTLLYFFSLILLILVFIPGIGLSYEMGARSWASILGLSFQPAEIVKLTMIIFLAAYLADLGKSINNFKEGFLVVLVLCLIPILLDAAQPDTGTAAILFTICFSMLFFAQAKISHLSLLLVGGALAIVILIMIEPYRMNRLTTFLHPELDPQKKSYQINNAFLAIGSGGIFGLGLGHSRQKFGYLPGVQADSIYAIISEEMGFIVSALFVVLIFLITQRCLKMAKSAPDKFSRLLVCGILSWFFFQSCLNIGAIIGILPLTGVPLPFVSHGGTALMINMGAVGILMNISRKISRNHLYAN